MATLNLKNAVSVGVPPITYGNYRLAVKNAKFGRSQSSGNPMITLTCEIVAPDKMELLGKEWQVAGTELRYYVVLTEKQAGRAKSLFEKLGLLEQLGEIDVDATEATQAAVTEAFDRLTFDAILWSEENVKRMQQTPEQRAANQPGSPLLDGEGKEIKLGYSIVAPLDNVVGNPDHSQF